MKLPSWSMLAMLRNRRYVKKISGQLMCVFFLLVKIVICMCLKTEANNWINNAEKQVMLSMTEKNDSKWMRHQINSTNRLRWPSVATVVAAVVVVLPHLFNVIALDGAVDGKNESVNLLHCSTAVLTITHKFGSRRLERSVWQNGRLQW